MNLAVGFNPRKWGTLAKQIFVLIAERCLIVAVGLNPRYDGSPRYICILFSARRIGSRSFIEIIEERLWAYMGGIAKRHGMTPIQIGGIEDHAHTCVGVPTTMSASQAAKHIKGDSSLWIHQEFPELRSFAWQDGYGVFSVSRSAIPDVVDYIKNQRKHHAGRSFEDEYRSLLRLHDIDFDERYLFG